MHITTNTSHDSYTVDVTESNTALYKYLHNIICTMTSFILTVLLITLISVSARDRHAHISHIHTTTHHADLVDHLPGADIQSDHVTMYSGYLPVKSTHHPSDHQLFYWLIEAQLVNPRTAPLVLFLNGGPGCSSMSGAINEVGPYKIQGTAYHGKDNIDFTLHKNSQTWSNYANLVFIDQPRGVGYSYMCDKSTLDDNTYVHDQGEIAEELYNAMHYLVTERIPWLSGADIYVTGESYAGKYITAFSVYAIQQSYCNGDTHHTSMQLPTYLQNDAAMDNLRVSCKHQAVKAPLSLKKVMIGNGLFDAQIQHFAYRSQALASGLMDVHQANQMSALEYNCMGKLREQDWQGASDVCKHLNTYINHASGHIQTGDIRRYSQAFNKTALIQFMNNEHVRHSLHVHPCMPDISSECNSSVHKSLSADSMQSCRNFLPFMLQSIQVVLFNGNFDLKLGTWGNEIIIDSLLHWSDRVNFLLNKRHVWRPLNDLRENEAHMLSDETIEPTEDLSQAVYGYTKAAGNLTLYVVAQSGHMVSITQPVKAHDMYYRVLHDLNHCQTSIHDKKCAQTDPYACKLLRCDKAGHGKCNEQRDMCECDSGYGGSDCSIRIYDTTQSLFSKHGHTFTHESNEALQPQHSVMYYFEISSKLPYTFDDTSHEHSGSIQCQFSTAMSLTSTLTELGTSGQLTTRMLYTTHLHNINALESQLFLSSYDRSDVFYNQQSKNTERSTAPIELATEASAGNSHKLQLDIPLCGHYAIKITNYGTKPTNYKININVQ